jgi:predicted ABC-type ATPase
MVEKFQKRIRIFAGPNGSGKTTVVNQVRQVIVDGYPIDFGTVVNADEIADRLRRKASVQFSDYGLTVSQAEFEEVYHVSNLFARHAEEGGNPNDWYRVSQNRILLLSIHHVERVAQVTAWVILQKLLKNDRKISFETVFSSQEKIKLLKQAQEQGYKVYLYFVSTNSPTINIDRVKTRVAIGGHAVAEEKIRERYYRSLNNLFGALQFVHRAFFFDNSTSEYTRLLARLDVDPLGERQWNDVATDSLPKWFFEYCVHLDPNLQAIITSK